MKLLESRSQGGSDVLHHPAGSASPQSQPVSPAGGLNVDEFRKVLMKTGLVLVVLGHVSFIAAAVLHGTMLRFVATTSDAVVLQYCVVDILSVTSAIVVMAWLGGQQEGGDWVPVRAPSANPVPHMV